MRSHATSFAIETVRVGFSPVTTEREFQVLLEGIVAAPDRDVWELPLLTEPERRHHVHGEGAQQRDRAVHP